MNINFAKFWKGTPQVIDIAIAMALVFLGMGVGKAISTSDKVELSPQGFLVEQQAIASQKDLERSLLIIRIQQGLIQRYESDTKEFSRRYKAGEELAEQAQFAADVIPEHQIEELEERVQESKVFLGERVAN
ncbi:MAG: hypothetical protein AAGA16_23830 [Cyanobacteria bacterium P01_E01_bin.35]